jgi:hypothetical protein
MFKGEVSRKEPGKAHDERVTTADDERGVRWAAMVCVSASLWKILLPSIISVY